MLYFNNKPNQNRRLSGAYSAMASFYSSVFKFKQAYTYLDSSYALPNIIKVSKRHLDWLYGLTLLREGKFLNAKPYLNNALSLVGKNNHNFSSTIFYHNGELHEGLHNKDSAFYFYRKALNILEKEDVHPMLKPQVLEKIAILSYEKGAKSDGFLFMQQAKVTSDSLFNILSNDNKSLFEIKGEYTEDLQIKEEQIIAQERLLELSHKARYRLRIIILILACFAAIAALLVKSRTKMTRMVYEKKIDHKKNSDILEIKNKELAVNALQLIEKENSITELLAEIRTQNKDRFKLLERKHKRDSVKFWDDFHERFTQINNEFYNKLLEIEASFTPTELKHCALIKLNFDSKEMAQILGISPNSLHMSRSRIRKKLNLDRAESLSNYIAGI